MSEQPEVTLETRPEERLVLHGCGCFTCRCARDIDRLLDAIVVKRRRIDTLEDRLRPFYREKKA